MSLPRLKQVKCSKSLSEHSNYGVTPVKSNRSEQKEIKDDSILPTSNSLLQQNQETKSVTVESPQLRKKKIWKDKFNTLKNDSLITELSQILDRDSTLKEKDFKPYWNQQSEAVSKKLWLPTKIDSVDSVLSCSKQSSVHPMGKSWFSIEKKHPPRKSSSKISLPSSLYSHRGCTDCEVTPSRNSSSKQLKTMKFRAFPTEEQKRAIQEGCNQYRWYYNASLTIVKLEYARQNKVLEEEKELFYSRVRDGIVSKYRYEEKVVDNIIEQNFVYDENNKERLRPEWIPDRGTTRTQRGAIEKLVWNFNSALSLKQNGYIKNFKMKPIRKKDETNQDYIHFEDKNFPVYLKQIKSYYWYRDKNKKRVRISFQDVFLSTKQRGIEVFHEKQTDRYFIHYPVEINWFPSSDQRIDKQDVLFKEGNRLIALDPGVRKFMVGYDPRGTVVFFGEGACKQLTALLMDVDNTETKKESFFLWKRIKNMVTEMHNKVIHYLIENYDMILLPDFRILGMVRKKNLSRQTKRLLYMFSFHKFKERLTYQCKRYGKDLLIVDESYTSKTCGCCGILNDVQGCEIYKCGTCGLFVDRDVNGSRNILIKNIEEIIKIIRRWDET